MKVQPMLRLISALLVFALVAGALVPSPRVRADSDPLVVIMSAKSKVTGITMAELNRVFRGMLTRNEDGDRFVPLNKPHGTPARTVFDRVVLSMTPDQAQAFWIDQRIRGAAAEPRILPSAGLAAKLVGVLAGAITYVPRSAVTNELKILRVEGKLPDDAGYPLR
jgi:hypothetical protein